MKRLVMGAMVACAAVALAMPTQQELKKVQPMVAELMAPTMDDFKAKKKTAAEVADMAVKYAGEAETEAAKFMLYRSSIPYYVRGEAYDKAADAVELMKANVKDVPASVIEEIISKATVRATAKKAPRLFELYRQAKAQSVAEKDVAAFRAKLKKNPGSLPTVRNLAEALATSGDWDAALKEFTKLKDGAAQIAKKELDGSAKSAELGEFWWSYKPTYENADDTFEMHATVHYRKALAAGEITGLKKNIVEQRIAKYAAAEGLEAANRVVEEMQLIYKGYLPRQNTLLWKGVSVDDIQEFSATLAGKHVTNPSKVVGYVVKSGKGWKAVQFQVFDDVFLKCVHAKFEQKDDEVRGYVEKAEYAECSVTIGTDFTTIGSAKGYGLCFNDDGAGYGIKDLQVTVGKKNVVAGVAASAAPASTEKATPASAEMDGKTAKVVDASRAKPIVIKMKKDIEMEFVACPAGSFDMGFVESEGSPNFKHRVNITRPFWICKHQVTWKQWSVYRPDVKLSDQDWAFGGLDAAVSEITYNSVGNFCDFMNKRYKAFLPRGCVYRLPTEAEWEYAVRANCKDPANAFVRYLNGDCENLNSVAIGEEDYRAIEQKNKGINFNRYCKYPQAVCKKEPNDWGVYDMLGNGREYTLDKFEIIDFLQGRWGRNEWERLDNVLKYEKEETDPLRYTLGSSDFACALTRSYSCSDVATRKLASKVRFEDQRYATFRLVIGPDLVSEWKAKNGKK